MPQLKALRAVIPRLWKTITSSTSAPNPEPEPRDISAGERVANIAELVLEILSYLPDADLLRMELVSRFIRQVVISQERRLFLYKSYWAVELKGLSITRLEGRSPSARRLCIPNPDIFDESKIRHDFSGGKDETGDLIFFSLLRSNSKWTSVDEFKASDHMNEFLTEPAIRRATVITRTDTVPFQTESVSMYNKGGLRGRDLVECLIKNPGSGTLNPSTSDSSWSLFEVQVDSDVKHQERQPKCYCISREERDVLINGQWGTYVKSGQSFISFMLK